MTNRPLKFAAVAVFVSIAALVSVAATTADSRARLSQLFLDKEVETNAVTTIKQGRETFRHETFGDEGFWGDTIRLHQAVAGEANGGVGPGVSPATALSVGLKVDSTAIPTD